jgi:signal transduction histidine kinase
MQRFQSIDRLIDWFIPAELLAERELRLRARMFLLSHMFGPFLGNIIPGYLYFIDPGSGHLLAVLAAAVTSFWIYPFLLKFGVDYATLALASIQNLLFSILWGCYFYGGVSSPFLPWLLTAPLLAFFYLGPSLRYRVMILSMMGINFGVFFALHIFGFDFPESIPLESMQIIGVISILSASVYVSVMSLFYAKILASQTELEGEASSHLSMAAALRLATTQAEKAGVAKAEFLAKMSHELRTPLNAVIGYSQMLLEDTDVEQEPHVVTDLNRIHAAGKHLLELVNAILDISKIEAGKMEVYVEDANLTALVETAVNECARNAQDFNCTVSVSVLPGAGIVRLDVQKVEQILRGLIDHAVESSKNAAVDVTIGAERQAADLTCIIVVKDSGNFIPDDVIPTLFENFGTRDDLSASKYGGAGLALPLCSKLVHLLGGTLAVKSKVQGGNTFTVTLPIDPDASTQVPFKASSRKDRPAPGSEAATAKAA